MSSLATKLFSNLFHSNPSSRARLTTGRRKIILFAFLFLIISGIILPTVSSAFTPGSMAVPDSPLAKTSEKPAEDCKSNLSWYKSIVAGMADILLWGPKQIAYWATGLASWVISIVIDWPITNTKTGDGAAQAFVDGWKQVRNLANMLIVLGFVVVGIATAIRIREYEAKKILPKLIIIALLINFSGLFCGIIIDASRITMTGLLRSGTPANMGNEFYYKIEKAGNNITCDALKENDLGKYVSADVLFGVIYLAIAVCFIYLSFMLTARYAVLGILFILSPLAFVFWAFPIPHAKDLWNKWWENFIKWAFIGVSICFFLWLTDKMVASFATRDGGMYKTTGNLIFYLSIVLVTLIAGIKISVKSSAMGASAVMGLAGGAVGYMLGAAGGSAKFAASPITNSFKSAGEAVKNKATAAAEKLRLVPPGTAKKQQRAPISNYKSQFSHLNNQEITDNLNKRAVWTNEGVKQRAALAELAVERGVFDAKNPNHLVGLKNAQSKGFVLTSEHIEKDPRLAPLSASTMDNLTRPVSKGGKGLSQAAAEVEAVKQTVEGLAPREFKGKISTGALGDINVAKHMNLAQADEMDKASPKKKAALKEYAVGGSKQADWDTHILATADPARQAELVAMQARFGTF